MNRLFKATIFALILLVIGAFLSFTILPAAVRALPGQVRGRLPSEILRAVTTPLPTALPAPQVTPAQIAQFITTPSPTPTHTAEIQPSPTHPLTTRNSQLTIPYPPPATRHLPPATYHLPLATHHPPLATRHSLTGFEITPQKLNNCGPATLSINLNYYGLEHSQLDIAGVVKPHYDDRNVSPEELVDYTNNHTPLRAVLYRGGDLELAKRLIAAGFPVVIEKGYEPDAWQGWMGHYLTLYGYDEAAAEFMTLDTFLGPWDSSGLPVPYEVIDEGWQQFNYTFFVVYEAEQEQQLKTITGPILNDEEAMWRQALEMAKADIVADAEDPFAWFNVGSSLTHLADITDDPPLYAQAAAAFDQARLAGLPPRMLWYQFEPYEAYLADGRIDDVLALTSAVLDNDGGRDVEETFLYRGHARLALGETDAALLDYRRALELRPGFTAAQEAVNGSMSN